MDGTVSVGLELESEEVGACLADGEGESGEYESDIEGESTKKMGGEDGY